MSRAMIVAARRLVERAQERDCRGESASEKFDHCQLKWNPLCSDPVSRDSRAMYTWATTKNRISQRIPGPSRRYGPDGVATCHPGRVHAHPLMTASTPCHLLS